jgi:hypothetical protein
MSGSDLDEGYAGRGEGLTQETDHLLRPGKARRLPHPTPDGPTPQPATPDSSFSEQDPARKSSCSCYVQRHDIKLHFDFAVAESHADDLTASLTSLLSRGDSQSAASSGDEETSLPPNPTEVSITVTNATQDTKEN